MRRARETFELELLGGAVERRFRKRRPETDEMPWSTLDLAPYSQAEITAARVGWTDLALQEYGAAASQANALRLIVAACAPLDLSAMLAGFSFDELVHTEICARMADDLGGAANLVYPPEEVFPPCIEESGSRIEIATKTIAWEFCVGETLSLGMLKSHRRTAKAPLLKAVWSQLAKDEAAHARFGWLFLDWAAPQLNARERRSVLQNVERATKHVERLDDKVRGLDAASFTPLGVFGSSGKEAYLALSRKILAEEIVGRLRSALT